MSGADVLGDINAVLNQQPANAAAPAATGPARDVLGDINAALAAPSAAPASGGGQAPQLLPAAPYGATDAAVHGLTLGLSDAGRAGIIALGRYLRGDTPDFDYSQAASEVNRGRDAYAASFPVGSFVSNLTGAFAGPGGPAMAAIKAVSPLAKIGVGAAAGAGIGGIQGAADNNTSVPEALSGATTGAEIGAVAGGAPAAIGTLARAAAPAISPAAQTLQAAGVQPTPGAASGGLVGAAENLLSRVPILGTPINAARAQAKQQFERAIAANAENFNRGAVNDVLGHIGESLAPDTKIGNDAIAEMQQKVSSAYHAAIPDAGGPLDAQAQRDITNAVQNARLMLPKDRADQFENFVNSNVLRRVENPTTETQAVSGWQDASQARTQAATDLATAQQQATLAQAQKLQAGDNVYLSNGALQAERDANAAMADAQQRLDAATKGVTVAQQQIQTARAIGAPYGTLSGQALKDADTDLGREAATYTSGNTTPDERKLGDAYRGLQGTLRDWIARVTPENAADLQAANAAYSKQLRIQNAAGRNMEGVFTPANLAAAAKKYSSDAQYARGGALMQDYAQNAYQQNQALADAGKQVLRDPNNMAGGHGAGIGLGVLGANLAEELIKHPDPHAIIAAGLGYPALAALYSNTGRRVINGLLSAPLPARGALGVPAGLLSAPIPSPAMLGPPAAGLLTQ